MNRVCGRRQILAVTGRAIAAFWMGCLIAGTAGCERSEPGPSDSSGTAQDNSGKTAGKVVEARPGLNVLLVSVDTQRADCLGCYGHETVKTPNVDRLAAEGTRFAWCISSAPLTLPSHCTMLTGSQTFVHGARDNGTYRLHEDNVTLAELFKKAGYNTGAEVAAEVLNHAYGMNQGFDTYGEPHNPKLSETPKNAGTDLDTGPAPDLGDEHFTPYIERNAEQIADAGVALINKLAGAEKPFFAFIHFFDPHWPHIAPERFSSQYDDGYFAETAYFDEQFGRLMQALDESGAAETTLVILTSDHGEGRGQHGEYTHAHFVYDTTLHVPLIFRLPGVAPAGAVVDNQVRLVDLASTIVDMAGIERTPQMQGVDLSRFLLDPSAKMDLPAYSDTFTIRNTVGYSHLRSFRADGWKYILAPRPELYHVAADTLELFDLASSQPERCAEMRQQLWDYIANSPPPPGSRGARAATDEHALRKLEALGYVMSASAPEEATGSELDDFEPVGPNPIDHAEELVCINEAMGSYHTGHYDSALVSYERLVELAPEMPLGHSGMARTLTALDRNEEAVEAYGRALELEPDNYKTHRDLGTLLAKTDRFDEAETHLRRAVELNPKDLYAHLKLGRVLEVQGKLDEAITEYEATIAIAPGIPGLHISKGNAEKAAGKLGEAEESFREVTRLNPVIVEGHARLADMLRRQGKVEEALDYVRQRLEEMPDAPLLHWAMAACYDQQNQPERAAESYERVIELMPENGEAHQALGMNLMRRGKPEQAAEHLAQALEYGSARQVALQASYAEALEKAGRPDEAAEAYEWLITGAPEYVPGFLHYARLLGERDRVGDAVAVLRHAAKEHPDRIEVANELAWLLATSSDEAVANGEDAVQVALAAQESLDTDNVQLLDTLAAAYARAGRFEEACATAERAVELAKETDEGLAERIAGRLELYSQQKAYVEDHAH